MSVWNRGSASKAIKRILQLKTKARRRDRQAHFRRKAVALEILESRRVLATEIQNYDFLQLSPADRTLIEIGGPQAGNPAGGNDSDGYDRLQVVGSAAVDGTLQVALVNDYVPAVGTEFEFLTVGAGGSISGSFENAEGLFSFAGGDRYFQVVQTTDKLKLVVVAAPGGLAYGPSDATTADGFGEFLSNDYFGGTTFNYSGSMRAPGFVDMDGSFVFVDRGSTWVAGATSADVFLGTAYGTAKQTGVRLDDVDAGLWMETSTYALTAAGPAAFVGLPGLLIDADFTVSSNNTDHAVKTTIDTQDGTVALDLPRFDPVDDPATDENEAAFPLSFTGHGTVSVTGAMSMTGDIALTKIPSGLVLFDVTEMELSITTGAVEIFNFAGLTRYAIDEVRGFQLVDMSFNDVHVFSVDAQAATGSLNSLTYPTGTPGPVEFTTIFDAIDVAVLNHRRYLDLTFHTPDGSPIDPDSITDNAPEFYFAGSAWVDATVDYVVQLDEDTFRYYLVDANSSNNYDLFRVNENFSNTRLTLDFIPNSWTTKGGYASPAYTLNCDVRSGVTIASADIEIGPVVMKGPFFNLEELQLKPLDNPAQGSSLLASVAVGVDEASLKFGGDSPKVKTAVTKLLGTFDIDSVVSPIGDAASTGAFRIRADKIEVEVKDIVKAEASGIYINYNPVKDKNHDGTVSPEELQAYNTQEIVRIDSATVSIPKINLTGALSPYTRPGLGIDPNTGQLIPGTTIPGLSVRNDGFRLGEAKLTYNDTLKFGSNLELKDVAAGVQDFGVTFGQSIDFDGSVFIAADEAKLFPGKKFSMTLSDSATDSDTEAVRATLKFTDNSPSGFAFKVDSGDFKFADVLTVHADGFELDTTNTGPYPIVQFGAIGATIKAGPLKLGGEIRNFGFLEDGSIKTFAGFGVFFSVEKADSKSFKWPEWLPIQITELGIQWRDLNNKPEDFKLVVSAAVDNIKGIPKMNFSGAIKGIEIDVGLLQQGKFPITGIESIGVSATGDLFGGKVTAGLIGGIIPIDSLGNEVSPLDQITPIVDRVFFIGIEGGFEIAGKGGFTIRLALTEKGPLGVQVTGDLPQGILLEPISGLKLSGFSGGVEFFKSLPDAYKPEDLLDPNFAPALSNSTKLDAGQWLAAVRRQTLDQYRALKENPVAGGFLAAFTSPMLISGGGQIVFHTPEEVLKGNVEVRISTDGKILLTGDLILMGGLQRCPVRLFADLTKIAKGNAKILMMAQDIPAGPHPILPMFPLPIPTTLEMKGAISMKYFGPDGEEVEFFDTTPTASTPSAIVVDPAQEGSISQGKWKQNGFIDLQFKPSPDATLDTDSITDSAPEFSLVLPDDTVVPINGAAVHAEGQPADVYRYQLPATLTIEPGQYAIRMLADSFQDNTGARNPAAELPFSVVGATVELAGPADGDRIDRADLNRAGRLAVRFLPTPGSVPDASTILDTQAEFELVGAAAAGVTLGQPLRDANDDRLYYFPFTGTFGIGQVQVRLLNGAFTDSQNNVSTPKSYAFTVTGPEATLREPAPNSSINVAEVNALGYLEVYFSTANGAALDASSLTDAAPEIVLAGAGAGVSVSGVAVPVAGETNVYRYALLSPLASVGEVRVQFLDGSFQDVNGVLAAANTESFTAEGVGVALADPLAYTTTGVTLINSRGYIDLRFTPTPGATLDEATIVDAAKEFQFTGDAALNVTPSGIPTSLGGGVYRYPFTGQFEVGKIGIEWIADSVADDSGIKNAAGSEEFVLDAPAAELFYPAIEMRADRSELNDRGYIDIKFNDRTGRGLDAASITDVGQEFELLVKNDAGEWVAPRAAINGAALKIADDTYRYYFSNFFNPGVVRVQFLPGSFLDADGAQNLAEEQQFAVVSNTPSFEFQIEGDLAWRTGFKAGLFGDLSNPDSLKDILKMVEPIFGEIGDANSEGFQKLRDIIATVDTGLSILQPFLTEPMLTVHGFLRFGSELLVDGGGQTIGARTTIDMSGSLSVYLIGPVAAAAGRVVVEVTDESLNLWGVMELQAKLDFLRKVGIDLRGFANLQFNTTGDKQTESLTLLGFGENGSDLTQTYMIDRYSFQVSAAGKLLFHVPTFDDANPFGTELFRISGAASVTIGAEGLSMFAKGDLEIGPPEVRLLDISALGVFVINDDGFAGDIQVSVAVGDIPAIRDYFQFDVSARAIFNVTGKNQEVKILDRFMEFLTEDFKARLVECSEQPPEGVTSTFANAATKCYVVGAAPPPRPKAQPAPAGPYVVIMAEGNLMIAQAFRLHGDFYFEVNSRPEMFVTVNASMALDPLGAVVASGTLHIDEHGAYGGLQLGGSLDLGPLKIFGAAQFEFNTQSFTATVERYKFDFAQRRVTDEREEVILTPGAFRIHVAGFLGIDGAFQLQGQFLLENQTDIVAVHVDAKFDAFGESLLYVNGDAAIVKHGDTGFVCNLVAMMRSPVALDGVFELTADFRLRMNTRGGSGTDSYDLGVQRNSFYVSFDGDMKLLSLLDLHGHGVIEYSNGLFRMDVSMGFELLGSSVYASGFFSSEGEFELYVAGHLQIGFPGFGVRGDASFYISRLDDNGKAPYGDLNFVFNVYGSIGAQVELFGINLAGINLSFGYFQDNGRVWIKPCVQLIAWEACSDFTIMYIKPPPKVFLAGNIDDVEGTAFHGGELYLNMGPRAYLRNEQTDNIHEGFQIEGFGPDDENGGEIVRVKSMGRSQTFRGVTKIIANGGSGHDYIEVTAEVMSPVEIHGGDRRDFIRDFGSGPAVLDGGSGDDDLQGGFGDDQFLFADDFGRDVIVDMGGSRDYDFSRMTEGTTTTVDAGRMIVQPSGYNRRILGYATINGVRVPLLPDRPSEVLVLMPGHSFHVGDTVKIDMPDMPAYSKEFTVASVTANTFNFIDNNFTIAPPRGVPVLIDLGEASGHQLVDALVFHDGFNKAFLKFDVPTWFPVNGMRMEGSAKAYTGVFPLTLERQGWYSFAVSYDDVREELDTTVLPDQMEFGAGDDKITFNGNAAQTITLADASGGFDTLQIQAAVAPTFTLVAGRAVNNNLDVTYSGFDRLNLLDPTVDLVLQSTPPGSPVDLGAVGLGIVAQSVVLPFDLTAASLEVNSRDSFTLDHGINVESLDLRVFGDGQGITVVAPLATRLPLTGNDSIQLFAPDGDIVLPGGVQLTTHTASIKAKSLSVPQNRLDLSVDTLTLVTAPGSGDPLDLTNDRPLTLTKTTDHEKLLWLDGSTAGAYPGVTWTQTASAAWKSQVYDDGDNPYALVVDGRLSITLSDPHPNDGVDESTLTVDGGLRSYAGDISLTADEMDFTGGAATVQGVGALVLQALSPVFTYRLGTAGESGGGAPIDPVFAPNMLDLTTRDLAALADGFSSITIGRSGAGNAMRISDAFHAYVVKATNEPRDVDSSLKDETTLLAETFVVEGDARAPHDLLTLIGKSLDVKRVNLHTPNDSTPDSGLTAKQLVLDLQDTLQVSGWLIGETLVDINIAATAGDYSLISDMGSVIRQTGATGALSIDASKALRIASEVSTAAAGASPALNAGTRLDLLAGSDVAATGANATIRLAASQFVSLQNGSVVRAGVAVDFAASPPSYSVTGANGRVIIDAPHELFLGGLVVSSGGLDITAGAPLSDHADTFQALTSTNPQSYLAQQTRYAVLLTGTLAALGAGEKLQIASAEDVIIYGNISLPGAGADLVLQSDKFVYVEGQLAVDDSTEILGGVALDGTSLGGADGRGTSVYIGRTGLLNNKGAGAKIKVAGGQDVEIHSALVAGGSIGPTGVTWAGDGSAVTLIAGQQLLIDAPVQAAGDVTINPGTAGADDAGRNLIFTTNSGLNAAGLGAGGAGSVISINTPSDIELAGNITAGATIRQQFGGQGQLLDESYLWSGRDSRIVVVAGGRVLVGGDTTDINGAPVQKGSFLRASERIEITAGANASGFGVVVYAASGLTTENTDSQIVINSPLDADIEGSIVAGGAITLVQDAVGQTVGYRTARYDGTSTVAITADHQVRVGREIYAGQQIELVGGLDPVDGGDVLSGKGVLLLGSAYVHTLHANGVVNLTAPDDISVLAAFNAQELAPTGWPEAANGRLSQDVTISLSVVRGFTYSGTITVRAADTATNKSLEDLRKDVQAAIDAATFTVTESKDLGHPVGSSFQPTQNPLEIRAALRDGKLVWTSPFTIKVDGASVNADLLGFDVPVGQAQSSETRYSIASTGVGSVVNIGPAVTVSSGGSPELYLGGRILAHTGVNLFGGWQSGDLQLTPQGLILDYSGAIELLAGSIVLDGGDSYELRGDLIAHGADADVVVNAGSTLVLSGRISAGDKAELSTTATGGTMTLRTGSRIDAGNLVTLQSDGLVEIDGLVGSMIAPTALVVSSLSDDVHVLPGAGRLQADQTVTVLADEIDFAGVLLTSGATADPNDFEVTLTAPSGLRLSGKFDTAGSVEVSGPTVAIYDFTASQSGADSRWSIVTQEDDFTFGRIMPDGAGRAVARAAQIQAVKSLELSVATRITVGAGSQLSVSGDNGQLKLTAPTLDIIGGLYAGATFDKQSEPQWVGHGADITLAGKWVTVGGLGPDAGGTMVTRGGLISATGLITIDARNGGLASSFKLEGPSRIETTTVVSQLGIQGGESPAVVITSEGLLRIYGAIDARGTGADVTLSAPGEILVDGFVHADDELRATSGGGAPVSIQLTQLLLKTDAAGILLDASGRKIDQQGNLINAAGQYVDANGAVLPAGATPVLGGAPVRLSGGSLDGGLIVLTGPTKMNLLGQIGKLDVVNDSLVSGTGSLIVTTPDDVLIAGRIQVENSADIRGANLTLASTGAVIGKQLVHLLADQIEFTGFVGGAGNVVLNSVGDFEVRGVVQSGGDVHVNAGIDRSWTDQKLLSATLAASELGAAYVYVLGSGVLDASGAVRIAAGGDFKLAADAVVTPNLTSVTTPVIVQQERKIDVVVGTRTVEDGTYTEDEVRYVPTTVTEQTGTTLVKIGTAYHTLDIKLSQDGYFDGHTIREYFVQNVDYQNEEIPWTSYSRQIDGKVVYTGQTPAPENPVPAPEDGTTFAQLTDDQQNVVLDRLGYKRLFNFSYSNGQTYQTINGNTTILAWTPDWANDDRFIHYFDYPGIDDKFIRLPEGAIPQFLRVVSQGSRALPDETVGRYRDHADVRYSQVRSSIVDGTYDDDFDNQIVRYYVTAVEATPVVVDGEQQTVRDGSRQFEIFDGRVIAGAGGVDRSLSHVYEPIWYEGQLPDSALDVSPNLGYDVVSNYVMAQDGYLADSAALADKTLYFTHPEQYTGIRRSVNYAKLVASITVYDEGGWIIPPNDFDWTPSGSQAEDAASRTFVSWGDDVTQALNYVMPNIDFGLDVNGYLRRQGFDLPHDIARYAFNSKISGTEVRGSGSYRIDARAAYGYDVYFKVWEQFKDYDYAWTGKWHDVTDRRSEFSYQWTTLDEDVYGTVPVFATFNVDAPVFTPVTKTKWRSEDVLQQQTVLVAERIEKSIDGLPTAAFTNESLRAGQLIDIDAGQDASFVGLTRATGPTSEIIVRAARDVSLDGLTPGGAAPDSQAAIADLRAGLRIDVAGGRNIEMKPNAVLSADDGDPNTHTGEIDLTAGETLTVRSDAFGGYEVHLHAGGDVYLQASLDSGHLVDVQAGLGPTGIGSIITDVNTDIATSGSEIHFKAGANGGNLQLTDAQIYTAGPIELSAPAGSLVHTGGRIIADSLSATVRDGITAHLDVRTIDATITGAGDLNLLTEGNVTLQSITVTNGQVDVQGFGDVVAVNVKTLGGEGSITIGSYAGNLLLGTIQASGGFNAEANVGEISGLPGGTINATDAQFQGQMTDNLNVVSDDVTLISQFPGDVIINHPSTRPLTLRQVYVLDGSLIVHTLGDLIVLDAQLLTNTGAHHVELDAGGDVIISNLIAGDYAASAVEADVLRAVRQLPPDAPIRVLNDVTIVAGGSIREAATGDDAVDIVAKRLTLQAGGSITGIEIAANEIPEATATSGSIILVERDGVGETSLGLEVLQASAPAGKIDIAASGSLYVTNVSAGGTSGIKLVAQSGSLAVLGVLGDFGIQSVGAGLTSGGGIELSGGDIQLEGPITANGAISVVADGKLRADSASLALTGSNVALDAQSTISLLGTLKANGDVSIVSHAGDVVMSSAISAKSGGALSQVLIDASRDLNLTAGSIGSVVSKLTLSAGREFAQDLNPVSWIVTGANGELRVTSGGDLAVRFLSQLEANGLIALTSTGYDDDGKTVGGNLMVVEELRGFSTSNPKNVSLTAANLLHIQQYVTASQKLTIDAATVLLSRQAILRSSTDYVLEFGLDDSTFVTSLAGSLSSLAAPVIEIGAGTRVQIEQGNVFTDDLHGENALILAGGVVTLDIVQVERIEYGPLWDVTTTYDGPLSGAGGLTKTGDGVLVLNGANTYSGPTSFEGGVVFLNGSLSAQSAVHVTDTTLYANADINGSLTIGDGGELVIGGGPLVFDTINTGPLTFEKGSSLDLEMSAAQRDRVNVTGAVTIEPGAAVNLVTTDGFLPPAGQQVTLISNDTAADPVDGGFSSVSVTNLAGEQQIGAFTYLGGDGNDISFLGVTMEIYLDANGNLIIRDRLPGGADDEMTVTYDSVKQLVTFYEPDSVIGIVGVIPGAAYVGEHAVSVPYSSLLGEIQINLIGGADSLTIVGDEALETITHRPTTAIDGSIDMTGRNRMSYFGVETIDDRLTATNRTFEFMGGGETIGISDVVANDSKMRVDSTLSSQIDFRLPISLLSVLAGSGDDTVNLNSIDGQFTASLVIDGGTDFDNVYLLTKIELAGDKTLSISTDDVNGSMNISAPGGVTIDNSGVNSTLSGVISGGSAPFAKSGSGTLLLTAANTYTGVTTITGGRLIIDGSLADGPAAADVVVGANGTLGGTGVIYGAVSTSGGTIDAGRTSRAGTLRIGAAGSGPLKLDVTGSFVVQLGGASPGDGLSSHDQVSVAGEVNLNNATLSASIIGSYAPLPSKWDSIVIIAIDGTTRAKGIFNGLPEGSPFYVSGTATPFYITYGGGDGNDVTLNTIPIVNGGEGDDVIAITLLPGNSLTFTLNGTPVLLPGPIPSFTYYGREADDVVTLDVDSQLLASGAGDFHGASPPLAPYPMTIETLDGHDRMSFAPMSTAVSISLNDRGAVDGFAGSFSLPSVNATFTNIDEMIGSQANGNSTTTGDTLTLNLNTSAVWNIFDRGTGTLNVGGPARDLDFAAFENLTGAPAATDLFTFTMSGQLNGVLNGREASPGFDGGDTLDYSGYTRPVMVHLGEGWASSILGGLATDSKGSSIENIYGGSSHDLLIGDGDSNLIRGNDGVDNIQAGDGNDLIQVSGKLDAGDLIQAGPGGANDYDIVRNIGSGPVYRTFFNTVFDSFDNSVDEYDGAGQPLLGMENMNFLHLGFTTIRNTPSIDSGDSNDDVTTSYNNIGSSPIVYSGGTGNDHVTLVFTPNQLAALTTPDFATLQAYLASPTGRTLNVTADPSKGNFTASNFETADIAFYEGGVITNVTSCVRRLNSRANLIVGRDNANDTLAGTALADLIFAQGGNDWIDALGGDDCVFGGTGNDSLRGGVGNDWIQGGGGNDSIYGDLGDDRLLGEAGLDLIYGGDGNDQIDGGADNDSLFGEFGNDSIWGRDGADSISGGFGNDQLNGGAGIDTVNGDAGNDRIEMQTNEGEFDVFNGGADNDELYLTPATGTAAASGLSVTANSIEVLRANSQGLVGTSANNTFNLTNIQVFDLWALDG